MEEIKNEIKNNIIEEENYVDEDYNENLNIMLDKYQLFFDNNIDVYNRILKIYYPEIKKYILFETTTPSEFKKIMNER